MTLKEMYAKELDLESQLNALKAEIRKAEHQERIAQKCESIGFPIGCIVEYNGEKRIVVGCTFEEWGNSVLKHILVAKIGKDGNASKMTKGVRNYEIKRVND